MAVSPLVAERHLNMEILAGSNGTKVWTTQNNNEQNGITNSINLRNTASRQDIHNPSLNDMGKVNGLSIVEEDSKEKQREPHTAEVPLTWLDKLISWRCVMVLLFHSSFIMVMFINSSLPMAMVCMVRPQASSSSNFSFINGSSGESDMTNGVADDGAEIFYHNITLVMDKDYEFDWNSKVQGLVLSSIMFSTFIGPLLVNVVKDRLGCKRSLFICNLISSALTLLSPVAARISPYCLAAIRIVLGLTQGANVPVVSDCVAWWAPQDEKLTMMSLAFTGINIGNILTSFMSGYLCLVPWDNGWPFVFYTFGSMNLLYAICWHFLSSHKPETHPYISEKEKQYIISHRVGMDALSGVEKERPLYRKLLTSFPVFAYLASGTCYIWSASVLFTYIPVFFNKVMTFSVQETGWLTSLASVFRLLGTFFWTGITNKLVPIVGMNRSRKLCIVIGMLLGGITAIMTGFFDDSYKWVVLGLLLLLMINQAVGPSTLTAVSLDMAPRYAGLLTGMYVSLGSFISISGPLITAFITANGTYEEWRNVWIIMGSLFIIGAAIFLIFGQASLQPWAQGKSEDIPHIVSSFVSFGRNFSSFIEAPISSEKRDEFFQIVNTSSSNVSADGQYHISNRGTVNEAFVISEDKRVFNSGDIVISRL